MFRQPYSKPSTPTRPNIDHIDTSEAVQVEVLVPCIVLINTFANITADIVIVTIPPIYGFGIFNNHL